MANLLKWGKDRLKNVQNVVSNPAAAVAQINPLDGGRTYKTVQQQGRQYAPNPNQNVRQQVRTQANRVGTGIGLGGVRSGIGTAQGLSGLYDLASPGRGTNRLSKKFDGAARFVDQTAKNEGVGSSYKTGQFGTDALTFLAGGSVAKAASKAPIVAKKIAPVQKVLRPVDQKITQATTKLANKGPAGRIAATTVKGAVNPANNAANVAMTAKLTGENASKGREPSEKTVATDPAVGTAFNVGLPLAGATIREGARASVPTVKRGAKVAKDVKYVTDKTDPGVRELDRQYNELNKRWQTASGQGRKQYEKAIAANRKARDDITRLGAGLGTRKVSPTNPGTNLPSIPPRPLSGQADGQATVGNVRTSKDSIPAPQVGKTPPAFREDAIDRVFADNPLRPTYGDVPYELLSKPGQRVAPRTAIDQSNIQLPQRTPQVNKLNNTPKQPGITENQVPFGNQPAQRQLPDYSKLTNEDASRPAEFEAVAGAKGTKNARTLMDELVQDERLNDRVRQAQIDGDEVNFFARKDKNGRGVGIEEFDPSMHRIEAGFVIDNKGKVLGNHIKVDETGIQVNVGGDIVNMDTIIGNPQDWSGNYKMMETMDRNIKNNAPDEATYRRTRRFLIDHKIKNEAVFKEELVAKRKELGAQSKTVHKAKPSSVSKTEYESDIFDFIEGNLSKTELKAKYGDTAKLITQYRDSTRNLYDDLLTRANDVFAKYGEAQVPRRKDYITHINELMQKPSFAGEMFGQLQNSILGEGNVLNRGGVPSNIAGRTENFAPRKRWNKFFQARQGGEFTKDPFKAVDAYLEPTLYNIHMTESAVRARAVEATFRAAEELKNLDKKAVSQTLADSLDKYKTGSNAKMVIGFQEFANALAGKTQRYDRQIIDSSQASETALRGWQKLQRVGSRATIIGNVQSVLSQTLGQPLAIADAGPTNYLKGIRSSIAMDTPVDSSPFIRARRADTSSPFRTKGQKAIDVGGVPLRKVELAMVEQTWNSQYHKALSSGYKGQKAILEADRMTEQVVGGRGIADMPEAYRSTLGNGFLQYTLEVSAQNKKVWQDLTPKQKITFVTAVFGANTVMGAVTGFEPLPDFMGAALDTYGDFTDETDERNTSQKTVGAAQRLAGETVEMNPLASAAVNGLLTQEQRKNIFGEESSVSRFEGTAAPVQVVRNAASAANNATKGNWTEARNDTLRVTPYGNQARKTITGAETNSRGYGVDSSGNPTFPAPQTPVGKAQTLVFGPSSSADAGIFYDTKQSNIKGKEDLAKLAASDNKAQTVKDIQQRRQEKREDKATGGKFKATGGKFKATVQGEEKDFDTEEKARDAAIRDVFKRTDTQARVYGDTLYYRTKSGAIRTKPVAEAKQTAEKKATKATAKTTKKKSTSRKSGGGARKARKFEFFAYGNPATSVNKSLRQLLDEAMA